MSYGMVRQAIHQLNLNERRVGDGRTRATVVAGRGVEVAGDG